MTQRLFLGGPADHRWIDTNGYHSYRVPVYQPVAFLEVGVDPLMLNDNVVTYSRHRYTHPAWRVVLTFYVAGDPDRVLKFGTIMPGWVHGMRLEADPLCVSCRADLAPWLGSVCNRCWLIAGAPE